MIVYQPIGMHFEPVQSLGMGRMRMWVSGDSPAAVVPENDYLSLTGSIHRSASVTGSIHRTVNVESER